MSLAPDRREAEREKEPGRRGPSGEAERLSADDWAEETNLQAQRLEQGGVASLGFFGEFRRKLACGEVISKAAEKLAEAIRFSGRITVTFHQGKLTKTVLEEAYFGRVQRNVKQG